jgi:2-C-methyl-D-erythritol 2,4-cyclodiphosphate synthase
MNIRVGEGWDTHALVEGRPLMLGGVQIPFDKGLLGHSDADVLLHAITDALLGAAGLGDIGQHFPDTDATYKGADSAKLLKNSLRARQTTGLEFGQCRLHHRGPSAQAFTAPFRHSVFDCKSLGAVLESQVNVKAKTAEKMGPVGEGLSMEARAVVLIHKP